MWEGRFERKGELMDFKIGNREVGDIVVLAARR